eukprot:TRINITY_DN6294_c0_g1_i1.p1 TRINITY_DN6294_c0_g1~~TRINITY_DN6294_c0_g1_i1.p1  ORF type:complete len:467 (+),score=232.62 TRINITY_DN6294_c0_g1_i1:82-1482(+)
MQKDTEPVQDVEHGGPVQSPTATGASTSSTVGVLGAVIAVLSVALLFTILWGADVFEKDNTPPMTRATPQTTPTPPTLLPKTPSPTAPVPAPAAPVPAPAAPAAGTYELGARPFWLADALEEGPLKTTLQACKGKPARKSTWSIGHRGAALQFPEHTEESYRAAALQGAGILECDVTFTKDRELVCRHAECDLHTTTDILVSPLASKCRVGFTKGGPTPQCCASDLTLAEFKTLKGKMDDSTPDAEDAAGYVKSRNTMRTDLYAERGTLLTHAESVALFKELGVQMTPELKGPQGEMPADFTRKQMIDKALQDYTTAGVPPSDVYMQSFLWSDVLEILKTPFGSQAVYLDNRPYSDAAFAATAADFADRAAAGLRFVAPDIGALVGTSGGVLVETEYSKLAKAAGLKIIAWTFERSAWYNRNVAAVITKDADQYKYLDFLAQTVKVHAIFSDWPATTTFYANCFGL